MTCKEKPINSGKSWKITFQWQMNITPGVIRWEVWLSKAKIAFDDSCQSFDNIIELKTFGAEMDDWFPLESILTKLK